MSKLRKVPSAPNVDGLNAIKYPLIAENMSHLLGEVLTVIDAATEGDKNKAIKDLIRDKFGKTQSWISELSWKELEEEGKDSSPAPFWQTQLIPLIYVDTKGKVCVFKW